ncbi:MAG: GIY-YIG nuclease family protein [Cetobacterium sp.]
MIISNEQKSKNVVYFLKSESGLVKIGTTSKLENRKRSLRYQCGFKEEDIFCVEGSYKTESFFKSLYSEFNTFGEWFKLDFGKLKKEISEFDIVIEEETNNKNSLGIIEVMNMSTIRHFELHKRYTDDLINSMFLKNKYNFTVEEFIKQGMEVNSELGEEELQSFIEESDNFEDIYDCYCFSERYGEHSDFRIDKVLKKYFNNEISFKQCIIEGFEILKTIEVHTLVRMSTPTESKIATLIESWKLLDLTDKEIYDKIKEKI